jgi:hypothetical protein
MHINVMSHDLTMVIVHVVIFKNSWLVVMVINLTKQEIAAPQTEDGQLAATIYVITIQG